MSTRQLVWLGAFVLVAACSGAAPDADEPPAQDEDTSTVFDPLTETLDRAEAVQDTVNQHAEDLRRQVEEQER
jgi:hypothetical protein